MAHQARVVQVSLLAALHSYQEIGVMSNENGIAKRAKKIRQASILRPAKF